MSDTAQFSSDTKLAPTLSLLVREDTCGSVIQCDKCDCKLRHKAGSDLVIAGQGRIPVAQ